MMTSDHVSDLEPAVQAGDDPREFAHVLSAVHDAAMSGGRMPARPRAVIDDSWQRLRKAGLDPDADAAIERRLDVEELEERRRQSGLVEVVDELARGLDSLIADGDNILVIADARGHVLWRSGSSRVLSRADQLGFIEGADWAESSVGTNAIGTALMSGRSIQVFSAEHFVRSHHSWTCSGAPIKDPRTGDVLGVVDVSGPAATIHPTTLALVHAVARLAESQLRERHHRRLDCLRAVAAPILARSPGPALAVDVDGWVAAVDAVSPRARLLLPRGVGPGRSFFGALGECDVEALPGGWLVRVADAVDASTTRVSMRTVTTAFGGECVAVSVEGASGGWTHRCSPRHGDILTYLARHRSGVTAAQMSMHLFGVDDRTVTVRAEMSRLRKRFGGLLVAGPYRFADGVEVRLDG
ncbi:GAF domain-containing protein [Gordonia sp. GONU]|uniref:helix-turn-helix domain-containing protein n=1 Tax=Gordonia TaxID=2053 RepID=UPI0021ACBBB8|nr:MULTISPECIES: helix-turn-helix domain-containing protein [Gordonia]MCR8897217.1 GAF domain-containing protein [Gordonia sp. GONU]MCZ0914265.1 GAF domain-containing protein [Gordonia amicalis]MCZ4652940.1 GAF domain-containing protein [Gordonia amicalis]